METLADLFDARSQLLVYHFMFHPDDEAEPLFYTARFITFMLIVVGIVLKNRPDRGKPQ